MDCRPLFGFKSRNQAHPWRAGSAPQPLTEPFRPVFPLDKLEDALDPSALALLEETFVQADKPTALVQGTLHMLILKTLSLEPMHGYGIGVRLEQISKGAFKVNAGSLFPALRRLERDGLIAGDWRVTENSRRAKYYTLTQGGRSTLARETSDWKVQTAAIARILQASLREV